MPTTHATPPTPSGAHDDPAIGIRADRCVTKRLGEWTTASQFDVCTSAGLVLLDFLLPRIDTDQIEVHLDVDHGLVTLLVPDGTRIVQDDLRWMGPGHVRDWTGAASPGGRTIHLGGEVRWGDVRVRRGGVAVLSLLKQGQAGAVRRAYRDGRLGGAGQNQ
jgi:hypothetical protein